MLTIDGSQGEGGGQVLRTALALAICTQQPLKLTRIRAGRAKPGLMRQHLVAVSAAAAISQAEVTGARLGSTELTFRPGPVVPGDYAFAIGSAGSTTLVLQTVLPPLLTAPAPTSLRIEGGTHNPLAPPVDFLEHAFLPQIARLGPKVDLTLERPGFYPAGGGCIQVQIHPSPHLEPLQLTSRGETRSRQATALVAGVSGLIARRELAVVGKLLGWSEADLQLRQLDSDYGPGNVLTLRLESEHVTEVVTGFGERGRLAETVAEDACRELRDYLAAGAPVGEYLADQLLLPLALAGGEFVTARPSRHTTTNLDLINTLLGPRLRIERSGEQLFHVAADPRASR